MVGLTYERVNDVTETTFQHYIICKDDYYCYYYYYYYYYYHYYYIITIITIIAIIITIIFIIIIIIITVIIRKVDSITRTLNNHIDSNRTIFFFLG